MKSWVPSRVQVLKGLKILYINIDICNGVCKIMYNKLLTIRNVQRNCDMLNLWVLSWHWFSIWKQPWYFLFTLPALTFSYEVYTFLEWSSSLWQPYLWGSNLAPLVDTGGALSPWPPTPISVVWRLTAVKLQVACLYRCGGRLQYLKRLDRRLVEAVNGR